MKARLRIVIRIEGFVVHPDMGQYVVVKIAITSSLGRLLVILLMVLGMTQAELPAQIINGDFESGTAGSAPASPWSKSNSTTSTGAQSTILLNAAAQSPFSSGTQGVLMTDASPESTTNGWTPLLSQTITSISSGTVNFAFDFSAAQSSGLMYTWSVALGATSASNFSLLQIGDGIGASKVTLLNVGGTSTVFSITPSSWYHVAATLDLATNLYSISFTNYDTSAIQSYSSLKFSSSATSIGYLGFSDSNGTYVNGNLALDNVSIVPEPGSAWFLLTGVLYLAFLSRSRKKFGASKL